jgi:hypothetical protein
MAHLTSLVSQCASAADPVHHLRLDQGPEGVDVGVGESPCTAL